MGRTCTVCRHEDRAEIEAALAARKPYRAIARQHGVSAAAVSRHREHVIDAVHGAQDEAKQTHAERLLSELARLRGSALAMLDRAEKGDDERTVALALRECRAFLELQGKLTGVLTPGGAVAIAQVNTSETPAPRADLSVLTDDELESLIAIQEKLSVAASELVDANDPEKYICVRLQKRREGPAHHFVYPGRNEGERLVYPAPAERAPDDEPEHDDEAEPAEVAAPAPMNGRTSARLGVPGVAPPPPAPRTLPPVDRRPVARGRQG